MRLHLTSAYEVHPGLDTLLASAALDCNHNHSLCDTGKDADAIVFIENTQFDDVMFKRLLKHELVQQYSKKVFMYNEMDRPWDVLPGLYTCMTSNHLNIARQRPFAYLSTPNSYIRDLHQGDHETQWLYSFMGAMSHACRRHIMKLPTESGLLKDTSDFNVWNATPEQLDTRAKDYANVLGCSQFVLCPRGIGTSSIRLYETMEAGRAPVIVADHWVPPIETDWSFAIQVPENKIKTIPGLLKSYVNEAEERGELAREAWLQSYAPVSLFNTLGNTIESLVSDGNYRSKNVRSLGWNKWIASGGLMKRTAVQKLRGQR